MLNGGNIENTFCNKEDKALPLQIQIYIVVTIHSNILLICTYFINIYACITIIGAEKRRRTSSCETHPFVDSALPHTQSTPLSESTLTMNQKQQDFTRQFETRPKIFVNSRTINASSIQRNLLSKFGKENITMSTLNSSPCIEPHTTTSCRPTQIDMTSQHINSGRYTIFNSKLIEHVSHDTDDELDITQGDIVIGNMLLC